MSAYKFGKGYSERGAFMGRAEYNAAPEKARTVRLFRVYLDNGGYDNGGAYWGFGERLWCALADEDKTGEECYRAFTRARNRREAIKNLGLKMYQLISKKDI